MTDIPIIFSRPMIDAQLDGRKNMTRRLAWIERVPKGGDGSLLIKTPSPWQGAATGDRLWVRETHYRFGVWRRDLKQHWRFHPSMATSGFNRVRFDIEGLLSDQIGTKRGRRKPQWWKRPAIFMPRWASRITWVLTATKIEPLQSISEADAEAEGAAKCGPRAESFVHGFSMIWILIHGDSWAKNPEVVALSGKVYLCNIDQLEHAA